MRLKRGLSFDIRAKLNCNLYSRKAYARWHHSLGEKDTSVFLHIKSVANLLTFFNI